MILRVFLFVFGLSFLSASTYTSFSAQLNVNLTCLGAMHSHAFAGTLNTSVVPSNVRHSIFDPAVDKVLPHLEFVDQKVKESDLRAARTGSLKTQLDMLRVTRGAYGGDRLKAYLIYSPYVEVRRAAAREIATSSNTDLHWHLWFAEYLERDPTLHAEIQMLSQATKQQEHMKNRLAQENLKMGVRDDFFDPSLKPEERGHVINAVIEGRSAVYMAEEAILLEVQRWREQLF